MKASTCAFTVIGILLTIGCTTTPHKKYGQFEATTDDSKLKVSFAAAGADYQRTASNINHSAIGWIENGTWRADTDAGLAVVKIYLATLFDGRAYQKKGVLELKSRAIRFSGNAILDFGEQGIVKTNSGPIEYVFYKQSDRPCVFIRKYWSDPKLQGDINQLDGALNWAIGSSYILASDCRPGGDNLQLSDLNRLFNGITAKDLYWPSSMFKSVGGTLGGGSVRIESSDFEIDISGTYVSDITTPHRYTFEKKDYDITITIKQVGNRITATDKSNTLKITGSIEGNTVKFQIPPNRISGYTDKAGEWVVSPNGKTMEGFWGYYPKPNKTGRWNLTKIE